MSSRARSNAARRHTLVTGMQYRRPTVLYIAGAGRSEEYSSLRRRVYLAIDDLTAGSIIVDSSKIPSHAELLMSARCDVSVIHLIRDPRACAYSWQRHKEDVSGQMPRYRPLVSTA